jgi:hypothetical protein
MELYMSLDKLSKKYYKHMAINLILMVIALLGILLGAITPIGGGIIAGIAFIVLTINVIVGTKIRWKLYEDIYYLVEDSIKHLRKKL